MPCGLPSNFKKSSDNFATFDDGASPIPAAFLYRSRPVCFEPALHRNLCKMPEGWIANVVHEATGLDHKKHSLESFIAEICEKPGSLIQPKVLLRLEQLIYQHWKPPASALGGFARAAFFEGEKPASFAGVAERRWNR